MAPVQYRHWTFRADSPNDFDPSFMMALKLDRRPGKDAPVAAGLSAGKKTATVDTGPATRDQLTSQVTAKPLANRTNL